MKTRRSTSMSAFAMLSRKKQIMKKKLTSSPALTKSPALFKKKTNAISKLISSETPKKLAKLLETTQKKRTPKKSSKSPSTLSLPATLVPLPIEKSEAEKCFEWLISPIAPAKFFQEVFEHRAFVVRRHNADYYKSLFSCKELDKVLREKCLNYKEDIDVTSYVDGVKSMHNGDGRAYAAVIWDAYQNGNSVRLLKPQAVSKSIWKLNSLLSEYFGSFVGGNIYLTPPGSQGFAPHYDDIEAFVLQLEGRKHWKVYNPQSEAEELPRYSSGNFSQEDLGDDFLDIVLSPGDLLYFPRGFIHQAKTEGDVHSMHLTLSTYQRSTWGDLLEKLLPRTLQAAFEENIEYRRSLPRDFMSYMGVANSDKTCSEREAFLVKMKQLTDGLSQYLCTDAAVDQMAKDFVHSALPPILTEEEKSCSIFKDGEFWKDGKVHNFVEIELETKIRLLRPNTIRIVMEDDTVRVYHSIENTRTYKELSPQYVEVSFDLAPAVEFLIESCPSYVAVQDLPLSTDNYKLSITGLLYDKGLLVTEFPLAPVADD